MNKEFISALKEIEKGKGISIDILLEALEAALISAYKKNFSTPQSVRVVIDKEQGDIQVYAQKFIVEEVTDDRMEVSLEDAKVIDIEYELGDVIENEVTPRDFGRIAAQTAKQVVVQRIREAERNIIFEEFSNRSTDIITGVVRRIENGNIFIDFGKTEGMLPVTEQIAKERYNSGDRIKVYIVEVKKTNKGPQIIISRTHPGLIKRLFELEVPEIHDGTVEIKSVSREPGARSKIAVHSSNNNVDAVGACVGPKGARVQRVVDELSGEKIDIINWNEDSRIFVANALSPSKVVEIFLEDGPNSARVVVPDNQLSLAIGKEGQNVRLAAKLTGWKIDIKSETQMEDFIEEHGGEEAFRIEPSNFTLRLAALMEEEEALLREAEMEAEADLTDDLEVVEESPDKSDLEPETEATEELKVVEESLDESDLEPETEATEELEAEEVNQEDEE